MLKIDADKGAGFAEITVDGGIERAEYEAVIAAIDDLLKTHDRLNVVGVVRDIGWVGVDVWMKDLAFHLTHRKWLNHFALVSDSDWMGVVTKFFSPLYPAEIQTFNLAGLEEARKWVRTGNVSRAAA
jgi:hypothetical protein